MSLTPHLPDRLAELAPYVMAGVFDVADVRFVDTLDQTYGPLDLEERLAAALAVRAPTHRHVCAELSDLDTQFADPRADADPTDADTLWWPEPDPWIRRLEASRLVDGSSGPVGSAPLRLVNGRVYLTRMERYERRVADVITERVAAPTDRGDATVSAAARAIADDVFGPEGTGDDLQRTAALLSLHRDLLVLAGGPGTGKTRTIAGLLMMIAAEAEAEGRPIEVAVAAPTGKAAARLNEAIHAQVAAAHNQGGLAGPLASVSGSTLHRLLGARHDGTWRHDSNTPLPHDVVIVDEVSMVALPLMARLFDALSPDATLVLVGDPFQLASVEAGTVLADIIGPARDTPAEARSANLHLAESIVVLRTAHRFDSDSTVGAAADAILSRDVEAVSAALDQRPDITAARRRAVDHAVAVATAARGGEPERALELVGRLGFLCASWKGERGVDATNADVAEQLSARLGDPGAARHLSPGSVVMVTGNNPAVALFNGDVGVVCTVDDRALVAFEGTEGPRLLPPHVIGETIPAWAITVHRSQGSEYDHVIVSLPDPPSPLLTRELLYTAVTRARTRVEIVGSDAAIATAVRNDIRRASGLRERLWGEGPGPASVRR